MSRALRTPKDPEAVGLAVLALRNFVSPVANPTDFEKKTSTQLKKLGVKKSTAKGLISNFEKIREGDRERFLGPIGTATTMPRRRIVKRDPNAVTTNDVSVPQLTLSRRFRPPLPGQPLPPDPAVLAPIDYTISFEGMHCTDETGWDRLGSDEIYIVTTAAHITQAGGNEIRTERHPISNGQSGIYGDVDSGETRIGPRAACWNGKVAEVAQGMSLTTVVFEHDYGDPDALKDEVNSAVVLAFAIASYFYPPAAPILALIQASGLVTDLFNWLLGTGDDEIGTVTLVLELADLEEYSRSRTVNLTIPPGSGGTQVGLKYHFLGAVNGNDYITGYQVARNPKAPLFPQGPVE